MAFPKGLTRRQRTGPGKLEKELRLFFVLYTDWLHTDLTVSNPKTRTPMEEIWRLIAPDAGESAFRRMLDRYLLELKRCGAVRKARVSKDGYCAAQFDGPGSPAKSGTVTGGAHLDRLARTTGLMRVFLDRKLPTGYGLGSYDRRFYTRAFFGSYDEAVKWYHEHFYMDDSQRRTMQRDMRTVWQVIREMGTEEYDAL